MIDNYKNLKQISLMDGKFYTSRDLTSVKETDDTIEITTRKEEIIIPKSAITRIEYFIGAGVDGKRYR